MDESGKQGNKARVEVLVHDLRNEVNVIGFACSALRHQTRDAGADVSRSLDRIEAAYSRCAELLVSFNRDAEAHEEGMLPLAGSGEEAKA